MKIVYCLPQLYRPGGIERIVTIKANNLTEKFGYEVLIIVADQKGKAPYYSLSPKIRLIDLGLDYDSTLSMGLKERLVKRRELHKLHKELLTEQLMELHPDITISTFTHEAGFLPQIKDGSKKVLEFHFCRGHKRIMADSFHFPFLKRLAYYYKCWEEENVIIPKYDQFVVLTEEDRIAWSKKVPSVVNIPNITPFEDDRSAVLDNHRVIAVGRLDAQKRFDRLIHAWYLVHKEKPDWHLDIFGEGEDREQLQSTICSLNLSNTIHLCKPSHEIKERYLDSSLFVMTSSYEGLPMTMLEAESLGLPIVSYDFPCGPKDVIRNGENGYLVAEGDENDLANRIITLAKDTNLRKQFGEKSKLLSAQYGTTIIMDKWNRLFKHLVGKD